MSVFATPIWYEFMVDHPILVKKMMNMHLGIEISCLTFSGLSSLQLSHTLEDSLLSGSQVRSQLSS